MKKFIFITLLCMLITIITLSILNYDLKSKNNFGVWWWNDSLDTNTYLEFAKENNINEIYYCNDDFNYETHNFIKEANRKNIKVYWLAGEYQWLENSNNLFDKIEKYILFQKEFPKNNFEGIHLDIEPHQHPYFDEFRIDLITKLISLAKNLKSKYPDITFDYDIPFWFEDEVTISNETKLAYQFMIDIADRVFIMSYRDTSEKIYSIAEEEILYAKRNNKDLVLCIETSKNDVDYITFYEEGKIFMQKELNKLKELLPANFNIAIHHIKSYYDLKN